MNAFDPPTRKTPGEILYPPGSAVAELFGLGQQQLPPNTLAAPYLSPAALALCLSPPPPPPPLAPSNYLSEMVRARRKRIFISFKSEDRWAVDAIREAAANEAVDLDFYDESLKRPFDSFDSDYIRRGLRERISRSSVTLCVLGPSTYTSKWVDWELKASLDKGNRIIGMGAPGGPGSLKPPRLFRQLGAPWYLWDLALLRQEIEKAEAPVAYA